MRHVSVKHVVIQLLGQRILFSYLNPTLRNRGFHGKDKLILLERITILETMI